MDYECMRYKVRLPIAVLLGLIVVTTISCHIRVIYYRRKHNNSYFSKYRQSMATMDQLLAAAYLKLLTSLSEEAVVLTHVLHLTLTVDYDTFLQMNNLLNCIIVPCYWLVSSRRDFKELWALGTCFWASKPVPHKKGQNISNRLPLTPRRPNLQKSVLNYDYEGSHKTQEATTPRRFSYGLNIQKALKQPKALDSIHYNT